MASPKTIPSKISIGTSAITPSSGSKKLYITAILKSGNLVIDGVTASSAGPCSFPSPVICDTFTPASTGQVSYFEQ